MALGRNSYSLITGDVDGDGDVDFLTNITPATGPSFLSIGFNQGPGAGPGPGPGCTAADTTATLSPMAGLTLSCGQASATLSVAPAVGADTSYEWQYAPAADAAWQVLPAASQATYQATAPGLYRVRLSRGGCLARTAAVEVRAPITTPYLVPNIFTPNGDGLNEVFALRLAAPRTSEVKIYNRWGREVFHTSHYGDFWTGEGSPAGLYYYMWRYSTDCDPTEQTIHGTVTLVR